jgi:hypothetical protein
MRDRTQPLRPQALRTQSGRRVTIADGMILIAATTVGLAMARSYGRSMYEQLTTASSLRSYILFQGTAPCVVFTLMIALIPLRLRRPRPRLAALIRQPGFAACCAGAVALGLGVLTTLATSAQFPWSAWIFWASSASWGDSVVPGAWLFLVLSGRWRAKADWIDRFGRVLGAFWILYLGHLVFFKWLVLWLPAL